MILCPGCRNTNPSNDAFCSVCGRSLEVFCSGCGSRSKPGARYCGQCGLLLGTLDAGSDTEPGSPEADRRWAAARSPDFAFPTTSGERKRVTVLLCDVTGSTGTIENLDPEQAAELLDSAVNEMVAAVHHYNGTVNEVSSDGIMALFGAPIAQEFHALYACCAAVAIHHRIGSALPELSIRVGLHSGEVLLRTLGDDVSMHYVASGITVHVAARMEQMAKPGTTRLTASTYRLAEGFIDAHSLGDLEVRGLQHPIEVYELSGTDVSRLRWEVHESRGLGQFVNRVAELAKLRELVSLAADKHSQIISLAGEPGIGKSRLLHEFLRLPSLDGWTVHETGCSPLDQSTAYSPFGKLLRSWFNVNERDKREIVKSKLSDGLARVDPGLSVILPALAAILDLPVEDEEWDDLPPPERRRRISDGMRQLVLAEARRNRTILIFEDLHWIDAESQAVLDELVERLPEARLAILFTFRPEYRTSWTSTAGYSHIPVVPLEESSTAELLGSLLGDDGSLGDLKQLLFERTRGTPLFLEEIVRALVETGALRKEADGYRLVHNVASIDIPTSIQGVVAIRIDRLQTDQKDLLHVASVIGREVRLALIVDIVDRPARQIRQTLDSLEQLDLLYQTGPPGDPVYKFKHALTQDVAYESLLVSRRRILHAKTVEAIERLYADRVDEHVERLAHHAVCGQVWNKAVSYLTHAGRKAVDRSTFEKAMQFLDQALETTAQLTQDNAALACTLEILLLRRKALAPTGQFAKSFECLRQAEEIAMKIRDFRCLAEINIDRSYVENLQGDVDEAIQAAERASALGAKLQDDGLVAAANMCLGHARLFRGDLDPAAATLESQVGYFSAARRHERRYGTATSSVFCLGNLAATYALQGSFADAIDRGKRACAIADEIHRPFDMALSRFFLGIAHVGRRDEASAITVLEQGLEHCHQGEIKMLVPLIDSQLGLAYALAGRAEEATQLLSKAANWSEEMQLQLFETWSHQNHALALSYINARVAAMAEAEKALELARAFRYRWLEVSSLRVLGECAQALKGDPGGALTDKHLCESLAVAKELGMRAEEAHCYRSWASLCRLGGDRHDADRYEEAAASLYRELGMFGLPAG